MYLRNRNSWKGISSSRIAPYLMAHSNRRQHNVPINTLIDKGPWFIKQKPDRYRYRVFLLDGCRSISISVNDRDLISFHKTTHYRPAKDVGVSALFRLRHVSIIVIRYPITMIFQMEAVFYIDIDSIDTMLRHLLDIDSYR